MPSSPSQAQGSQGERSSRIACFEWARALGCVSIVALHVYVMLWEDVGRASFGFVRAFVEGSLSIVLGRWAVPVFLMVTGALLLNPLKDVDASRIRRYVVRMLGVLATFGFAFCLMEAVFNYGTFSLAVLGEALLKLLTAQSWGHLWYVYALLGLYILTPVLRKMLARLDQRGLAGVLAFLYVAVLGTNTVLCAMGRPPELRVLLLPATFYYLLGWYAWSYLRFDACTVGMGILSLVAMLTCQALGHGEYALPQYCLVAPYGVLVFVALRRFATRPVEDYPLVALLADYSFGIYLVHPFFLHVLALTLDPLAFPPGVYELLAFVVALLGSVLSVALLRRLPVIKDLV